LRFATLYNEGGVYLDTDMYVLRPLSKSIYNHHLGKEDKRTVNGAILLFDTPHNLFIRSMFMHAVHNYREDVWGTVGPGLITKLLTQQQQQQQQQVAVPNNNISSSMDNNNSNNNMFSLDDITIMEREVFYPYKWQHAKNCFQKIGDFDPTKLYNSTTVHLNSKMTSPLKTEVGSVCYELLSRYCIFCNDTEY
jgi:mannosyltransferase OCH1-like enzyme